MEKRYHLNNFDVFSELVSNTQASPKRKTLLSFVVTLLLFLLTSPAMMGQVATYNIDQSQLFNVPNSCGTGSFYNPCDMSSPGFRWNDTLPVGAIVDSVVVRINLGVECAAGTRPTLLNNQTSTQVTTNGWCNCAQQEYLMISRPEGRHYRVRASNEFNLTSGGSCLGFSQSFSNLNGAYARVQVFYKTADIEVVNVKPATSFTSLCRQGEYEVDLTLKNNGPGPGGSIDVRIQFEGSDDVTAKVDVSNLAVGQTRTYRISEIIIPSRLGTGLKMTAIVESPDLNNANNILSVNWDVLSTPFGAEFMPTADFPGFPRDGNRFNQDFITYNKTYRYNISAPSAYSNSTFNRDWTSSFSAIMNGSPMPGSKFTYTPPQGNNNGFVVFNLVEDDLNSVIQFRYNVTDLSGNGCDSTTTRFAVVMPTPKPKFDGISVCEVDELQFVNNSTIASGTLSYVWDFGDGTQSTLFEPKKRFATLGSYPVKLVARSTIGFADSITVNVNVNPSPVVDFKFVNQCGNIPVQFENLSSLISGNMQFTWDFGNGAESMNTNPSVIFDEPGQYTVTLMAESDRGCFNSISKTAFSYPSPKADFLLSNEICGGSTVNLINNTSIAFSDWGNIWEIGNKGFRTFAKEPSYTFRDFGPTPVKLKVITQYGCTDSIMRNVNVVPGPAIDITTSDVCSNAPVRFNSNITVPEGMNVEYVWNIDGQVFGSSNPTVRFNNVGNKNVNVAIRYANGCASSASKVVSTGYRPKADFSVPDVVCAAQPVSYSNNTTIEFGLPQHTWYMGDGSVYTGVFAPSHIYNNQVPTDVQVMLVSTSANGICPDTAIAQVRVGVIPTCDFAIEETYLPGNRAVHLVPQQADGQFTWYFGDGRTSTEKSPVYQYKRDGVFNVRLVVNTPEGCMCEMTTPLSMVNASVENPNATQSFSVYPNPSQDGIFRIEHINGKEIQNVKVYNALGALLSTVDAHFNPVSSQLELNAAAGVYTLVITGNDKSQSHIKVMITK
jgi:PKD repeat protein